MDESEKSRRLKVLMTAPTLGTHGGVEAFLVEIAKHVGSQPGFAVQIAFKLRRGCQIEESFRRTVLASGLPVDVITGFGRTLWRRLRETDVVHTHYPSPWAILPAQLLGKPVVVTVENARASRRGWKAALEKWSLRLGERRWYIARFVAETWEKPGAAAKAEVVPAVSQLAHGWSAPAERRGFLFVGRWIPGKGLEQLVEAYARARLDRARWPLRLFGTGPLRETMLARIAELKLGDAVDAPGYVSEAAKQTALARSCWIVAPVSVLEDLGLTPIEGRALGVPAIVSRCGGLPEAAGEEAILATPGDVDSLVTALEQAATMSDEEYAGRAVRCQASLAGYLKPMSIYTDAYLDCVNGR